MSRLEELRELAEKATPGPWRTDDDPNCREVLWDEPGDEYPYPVTGGIPVPDANFIAAANPESVLALIALVEELTVALGDFTSEWGFDACRAMDDGTCRECNVSWPCPTEKVRAALASAATWTEE